MQPLPTADLRSNICTGVVTDGQLPMVAAAMLDSLPAEGYDPKFNGQLLDTTYFDTPKFHLRSIRAQKNQYLTIRLRGYTFAANKRLFALSIKTEAEKWREEIAPAVAQSIFRDPIFLLDHIPGRFRARLASFGIEELCPVVGIQCRRYAVEDDDARLTLDVGVATSRQKKLGFHVLEFKAVPSEIRVVELPHRVAQCNLNPLKLSKFLWATEV
jgi:hypothetical protein